MSDEKAPEEIVENDPAWDNSKIEYTGEDNSAELDRSDAEDAPADEGSDSQ